jgi:hypothetical protein
MAEAQTPKIAETLKKIPVKKRSEIFKNDQEPDISVEQAHKVPVLYLNT